MTPRSWLEINLAKLEANLATVRHRVGPSVAVCGVVKANAYGLGAVRIAQRLANAKVDMLAVYSPDQAQELVASGVQGPSILILMPQRELANTNDLYRLAVSGRLHLTVHDNAQLPQINRIGQLFGCRMPVHLYLDTGMSRSGLNEDQAAAALTGLESLRYLHLAGLYTHLAAADHDPAFTQSQTAKLVRFIRSHQDRIPPTVLIHAANTFATLRSRGYHHSMVRVGLGLFGYGHDLLVGQPVVGNAPPLQPIVRWLSRINHIQRYPKGSPVGYGCTYYLKRDSILGIVPVGYGDGYPLALGNRAVVRVMAGDGQVTLVAPVVGQVSMDQIVIDLTMPTDSTATVVSPDAATPRIGSLVELISDEPDCPCGVGQLAVHAGTNCYEMLCRLSPRLPRRYMKPESNPAEIRTVEPHRAPPVYRR